MITSIDTFKVLLVSDEYKIKQKTDKVIVIEQKDKIQKSKDFTESSIFTSLILPIFVVIVTLFIAKLFSRNKEKKESLKIKNEIEKLNQEIIQLKSSFQPVVLSTLQKIQENILKDKITTLQNIVICRNDLFKLKQNYLEGEPIIDEEHIYYSFIYQELNGGSFNKLKNIVNLNAYLFPDSIKDALNKIIYDAEGLIEVMKREHSYTNPNYNITADGFNLLKSINSQFYSIIKDIRRDLHLDDNFIHDFIDKYKKF